MKNIGCCNYNYYVVYASEDCYGLGEDNYTKFTKI